MFSHHKTKPRLLIVSKLFPAAVSHIGLGVSGANTSKYLNHHGIRTDVVQVKDAADLLNRLCSLSKDNWPPSHVVISAFWLKAQDIFQICKLFPTIEFCCNSHSNVGFLQADTRGTHLLREMLWIQDEMHNFHVSGNSREFQTWLEEGYGKPCLLLPNLYYLPERMPRPRPPFRGDTLRVGIFGAQRPLKNLMTGAAAALGLARKLHVALELVISGGREEGGGSTSMSAIQQLLDDQPDVVLKRLQWKPWPQFREHVGHMHLLLQPSYTESFNMVTADGIAKGVPSVVSPAIRWVPQRWKADPDDAMDIVQVGNSLLHDCDVTQEGWDALVKHDHEGFEHWRKFIKQHICNREQVWEGA